MQSLLPVFCFEPSIQKHTKSFHSIPEESDDEIICKGCNSQPIKQKNFLRHLGQTKNTKKCRDKYSEEEHKRLKLISR